MHHDLAPAGEGMKPAGLGRNELHVLDEHGDDGHLCFLRDEVNAGLALGHIDAIAAGALRKTRR